MKYIKISNTGEIDLKAFTLMGASTKDGDDSKIGFFGSGLKYAMAVLLRHAIHFKIYSGLKEIVIKTKREKFRDKIFNMLIIGGRRTSLTVEMGKTWIPWFCIREIYCNALDEGSAVIDYVDDIVPEENATQFYVEYHPDLDILMNNWDNYFSKNRPPLISGSYGRILNGGDNLIIYRRGVQAYTSSQNCLFNYDLINLNINESRVLDNIWDVKYSLAKLISKIADKKMIQNILDNLAGSWEEQLQWGASNEFNDLWLEIVSGYALIPKSIAGYFAGYRENHKCLVLPAALIRGLKKCFGDKVKVLGQTNEYNSYAIVEPEEKQSIMISKALDFMAESGFNIKYPIKPCIFESEQVLGSISDKQILLSVKLFQLGLREMVTTILEEVFHIESGLKDETRGFQNYLINRVVLLMEEKSGKDL